MGSPSDISKDKAIARIETCLHQADSSNPACADLDTNIDVLIRAYRKGDQAVLSEISKFSYLTSFFDDTLLSDTDGFLSAVNRLPTDRQNAIATGVAGEQFLTLPEARFLAIKSVLEAVPQNSPNRVLADTFLKAVLEHNASPFVDYFPPDTFTGRGADFTTSWYSQVLYAFGEAPLWRDSHNAEETWRFTHIGPWGQSRTVTLSVHNSGTGSVRLKWRDPNGVGNVHITDSVEISAVQVRAFLETLKHAQFWDAPTEIPDYGLDGAKWVLEGAGEGRYHLVSRWCPGAFKPRSKKVRAFAKACRLLLEYTGYPYEPDC
jgi:hypothetical protein